MKYKIEVEFEGNMSEENLKDIMNTFVEDLEGYSEYIDERINLDSIKINDISENEGDLMEDMDELIRSGRK